MHDHQLTPTWFDQMGIPPQRSGSWLNYVYSLCTSHSFEQMKRQLWDHPYHPDRHGEIWEMNTLETALWRPKHYVDDTFAICNWLLREIFFNGFHTNLNQQQFNSIQDKSDGKLAFLDVLKQDRKLPIYRSKLILTATCTTPHTITEEFWLGSKVGACQTSRWAVLHEESVPGKWLPNHGSPRATEMQSETTEGGVQPTNILFLSWHTYRV